MLPASTLAAISNVVALNLEPRTTMTVLGAILAPLLPDAKQRAGRPRSKSRKARRRKRKKARVAANAESTDGPRQRAARALAANPGASLTAVAEIAGVSRGTVVNARDELAAEARKPTPKTKPSERRERAQRFLKDALAHGPRKVSDVEEAAAKAHLDSQVLEQARGDLGIVTSRANAGGVQAVQWSLPAG
jgi:hypothetical protein